MEFFEIEGKRYHIKSLLGKGKGGYSYLVENNGLFVVKKIHHEPCDYYTFGNKMEAEIFCYNKLSSLGVVMPKMLAFDLNQELILKEYIEGDTVMELVQRKEMKEDYVRQMRNICKTLFPRLSGVSPKSNASFIRRGLSIAASAISPIS